MVIERIHTKFRMASFTVGLNKRAREEKLNESNKFSKEPCNTFLPFETAFTGIQLDSFNARASASAKSDATDSDDDCEKMDYEDDCYNQLKKDNVTEHLRTSGKDDWSISKSYPPRTKISFQNFASVPEADDNHGIATGKYRYRRKIDFLVDDLIRKTNRTLGWVNNNELSCIPSSIGPHPQTDMNLLVIRDEAGDGDDYDCNARNGSRRDIDTSNESKSSVMKTWDAFQSLSLDFPDKSSNGHRFLQGSKLRGNGEQRLQSANTEQNEILNEKQKQNHSGYVTHSDWPIEELDS